MQNSSYKTQYNKIALNTTSPMCVFLVYRLTVIFTFLKQLALVFTLQIKNCTSFKYCNFDNKQVVVFPFPCLI